MITLKPIAARLFVLTALSPFLMMCANQGTKDTQDAQGTEDADSTVHVSDATSIQHELAECASKDLVAETKAYCASLEKVEAGINVCMDGTVTTGTCPTYMLMTSVRPPVPCPEGQCLPFIEVPRVCFFSEKDDRAVEVFVNNKLIGKAKDVSYNPKTKERTVVFDLEENFKNTNGEGQNVMMARFPVTYRESGKKVRGMLVVNEPF